MSLPQLVHSSESIVHRLKKTVNCQLLASLRAHSDESETRRGRSGSTACPERSRRVNCSRGFSLIELLVACHPKPWRRKAIQGFSLIELLVVISIIGLLAALATASLTNAQQKGRDARRKADLKAVQQALELYFQANGKYPDASPIGQVQCNVTGDTSNKTWGGSFICGPITYMQQLPKDPTNVSQYAYYPKPYATVPIGYRLYANLENTNDPDLTVSPGCDTAHGNYCTQNP